MNLQNELTDIFKDSIFDNVTPKNLAELCKQLNDEMECGIPYDHELVSRICKSMGYNYVGSRLLIATNGKELLIFDPAHKEYSINVSII